MSLDLAKARGLEDIDECKLKEIMDRHPSIRRIKGFNVYGTNYSTLKDASNETGISYNVVLRLYKKHWQEGIDDALDEYQWEKNR